MRLKNNSASSCQRKKRPWSLTTRGLAMADAGKGPPKQASAFGEWGLGKTVQPLAPVIPGLFSCDAVPWVIGYSGGKDSTAVLQLVWNAIRELPEGQRQKPIHVISTDTLVEQPLV